MCIIAYKPFGVPQIDDDTMERMWDANRDGAGLMLIRPGESRILVHKGFMDFKDFLSCVHSLKIDESCVAVYHFRIGTSGGKTPEKTHPFPVVNNPDLLNALDYTCVRAVAHNGVLGAGEEDFSDTQCFIRDVLSQYTLLNIYAELIAYQSAGSKLLIMDVNEGVYLTGAWEEHGGCFFSNTTYKKRTYSYANFSPSRRAGTPAYLDGYSYDSNQDYWGYYGYQQQGTIPNQHSGAVHQGTSETPVPNPKTHCAKGTPGLIYKCKTCDLRAQCGRYQRHCAIKKHVGVGADDMCTSGWYWYETEEAVCTKCRHRHTCKGFSYVSKETRTRSKGNFNKAVRDTP